MHQGGDGRRRQREILDPHALTYSVVGVSVGGKSVAHFSYSPCTIRPQPVLSRVQRISPDAQAERQVVMQTLLLWCRAADNRAISISVLAKPTKALWAMSLDPAGARQLGEFDAIACFVHTIATYIDGGLTSEEPLDGSPRFIENMVRGVVRGLNFTPLPGPSFGGGG